VFLLSSFASFLVSYEVSSQCCFLAKMPKTAFSKILESIRKGYFKLGASSQNGAAWKAKDYFTKFNFTILIFESKKQNPTRLLILQHHSGI
jgi:hypothetical protein